MNKPSREIPIHSGTVSSTQQTNPATLDRLVEFSLIEFTFHALTDKLHSLRSCILPLSLSFLHEPPKRGRASERVVRRTAS